MRSAGGITMLAAGCLLSFGCNRATSGTADSAAGSTTGAKSFDEKAARAQIFANDSARIHKVLAKHVDSAMIYYDPNVTHLATGKVIRGVSGVNALFSQGLKSNPRDFSYPSQ